MPKSPEVEWGYEQIAWEGDQLNLTGFHWKRGDKQVGVDLAAIQLDFDWRAMRVLAHIGLKHPYLIVESGPAKGGGGMPFPAFFIHPRLAVRWEMEHGVLQFPTTLPVNRLFFSFKEGSTSEQLGTFCLSYEPDLSAAPLLTVDLEAQDSKLGYRFELLENDCSRIIPLLPFLSSSSTLHWKDAHGQIAMEGHGEINRKAEIANFFCRLKGENFALTSVMGGRHLSLGHLEADVNYSPSPERKPFWEEITARIQAKEGSWLLTDPQEQPWLSLEQIEVNCLFAPRTDPEFTINGVIVRGEERGPVQVIGRGAIQEDGKYWLETQLAIGSDLERLDAVLSLCQPEEEQHVLHVELQRADATHLDWIAQMAMPELFQGHCKRGSVRGKMILELIDHSWKRCDLEEVIAEGLLWEFPKGTISAKIARLEAQVSKSIQGDWSIEEGLLAIHEGEGFLGQSLPFTQLNGDIQIEANELKPSTFYAQVGKSKSSLFIHGTREEHLLDVEVEGDSRDLISLFGAIPAASLPKFSLKGALINSEKGWDLTGECLLGQEVIHAGFEWEGPRTLQEWLNTRSLWTLSDAWLRSEKLTEETYAPLISIFSEEIKLTGEIDLIAGFRGSQWNCSIQGNQLNIDHPRFTLFLPQLGEKDPLVIKTEGRALFSYDLETKYFNGDLPIKEGTFIPKEAGVKFEHVYGILQLQEGVVQADMSIKTGLQIHGEFTDLHIPFNEQSYLSDVGCLIDYDTNSGGVVIEQGRGSWVHASGAVYGVQLDRFEFNPDHYAQFDLKLLDQAQEIGRLNGLFEQNPSQGWDLKFDSTLTHFYGTPLQMGRVAFSKDGKLLFFEMKPVVKIEELQKQLKFILSSGLFAATAIDLSLWEHEELAGRVETDLKWEEGIFHFKAQGHDLNIRGNRIRDFNLIGRRERDRWFIDQLQADGLKTKAVVELNDQQFLFSEIEGNWNQLFWRADARYAVDQQNLLVEVSSIHGDLAQLKGIDPQFGTFIQGAFASSVRFQWRWGSSTIEGECTAAIDLKAPLDVHVKQEGPLRFSYAIGEELQLHGAEPRFFTKKSMQYLGAIRGNALIRAGQCNLNQIDFSLSRELLQGAIAAHLLSSNLQELYYESYLQGNGDLHLVNNQLLFKGNLRDGRYGIKDQIYPLENISLSVENGQLRLDFKSLLHEQPLWGCLRADLKHAPMGTLLIRDRRDAEGIRAVFRTLGGILCWESIEGAACGIDVALKKASDSKHRNATVLTGRIKVDGSRLDAFFPQEMKEKFNHLKLGNGYEFLGDLLLGDDRQSGFQLNGQLQGHQFELLGYRFERLSALVEANAKSIQISKLDIADEAGFFQIKKIAIEQNAATQHWSFHIPLLQVKDLQPSMMNKIDSREAAIKPLVIRNLSLTDIRGDLNDPRGWVGQGHLNFTNAFKKESTLFEAPIEMIKNLGLDPGLLTPIQGEIDLELRGDKFYLVHMKNAFSEGKRAQFFLSPSEQASYIDLNGNIHIDIRMRQDVVLKLTEAFMLTIRGTLDKPRYRLQY
jgi:hypothetical protein